MAEFRAFATEIEEAIDSTNASFFLDRRIEFELTCQGGEALGQCSDLPGGTVIRGIPGSAWRSDAFYAFTVDEYRGNLERYFAAPITSAGDEYGGGGLRLFALASKGVGGEATYMAITTAILDLVPSSNVTLDHPEREAHVFFFGETSAGWGFSSEIAAGFRISAQDWLSGSCALCYDYFERWEGSQ
jgi:hypothetical protein